MSGLESVYAALDGAGDDPRACLAALEAALPGMIDAAFPETGSSRHERRRREKLVKLARTRGAMRVAQLRKAVDRHECQRRAAEAEGRKLAQEVEADFEAEMRAAMAEFGL